jgi:hypothetical protein
MNEAKNLKLVVATFADATGAARALATIVPGVGPERIGQAAIVSKEYEGTIRFHETAHTSVAEGAAEGAGIGVAWACWASWSRRSGCSGSRLARPSAPSSRSCATRASRTTT